MVAESGRRSMVTLVVGALGIGVIIFSLALNMFQNQRRIDDLNHRIDNLRRDWEETRGNVDSINADRHKRTEIIRRFEEHFATNDRRLDILEGR